MVVNPFGIGDVLFTTPLLRTLRKVFPDATLGYLCNRRVEDLLRANAHLDLIFVFEKDEYRKLWKQSKREFFRNLLGFFKEIRGHKFDALIDLSLNWHTSFWGFLLGIPTRIGFNYRRRGRFLTHSKELKGFEDKHVVAYYLELLELLGIMQDASSRMEFHPFEKDRLWAANFLGANGRMEGDIVIGMAPGGGASWGKESSYKHWPEEHFVQLANRLLERRERVIVLLGDRKELPLCEEIARGIPARRIVAAGQTNLGQLSALIEKCRLLICNDGGILHLAVSQGIPTLSFFGPVDPAVYGPFPPSDHHRVLTIPLCCRPCYHRFKYPICERQVCLEWITPEEALEEATSLLQHSVVSK